jgi:hypothetical protein
VSLSISANSVDAHTIFKKSMEKSYENVKVSCNACHVKGKSKTERNDLGALFYEEFKDEELTKNWKSKKGAEKKKYQTDVMTPAFEKALKTVKEKKKEDVDKTYHQLIEAAELDGLKLKEKKDD